METQPPSQLHTDDYTPMSHDANEGACLALALLSRKRQLRITPSTHVEGLNGTNGAVAVRHVCCRHESADSVQNC